MILPALQATVIYVVWQMLRAVACLAVVEAERYIKLEVCCEYRGNICVLVGSASPV